MDTTHDPQVYNRNPIWAEEHQKTNHESDTALILDNWAAALRDHVYIIHWTAFLLTMH